MNAEPPQPLLFEAAEQRLAALDELARQQWLGGLTHSQGSLEARLEALVALRRGFRAGRLAPPETWLWPPPAIAAALHQAVTGLGLAAFCADQEELSDTVVTSILFHLDFIVDYRDRGADQTAATQMAIAAFTAEWQERCGQIAELVKVFGSLPDDDKNTQWDRIRGLLRSSAWQEVLRSHRLLEHMPELVRLIRGLGRARPSEESAAQNQSPALVMQRVSAERPQRRSLRIPDMPGETRGIYRSERIARMLPAEAMLLRHPLLRLVWHARRAERSLLSYEDDDRLDEVRLQRSPVAQPRPGLQTGRRPEMGPILVCVDTSGSMQGGAEAVAKAIVLEAMRTAHAQQRPCQVFAFGGPGELIGMELAVNSAGIEHLTGFLGQAFRGGTDICGPLEQVIAKLEEQHWALADLLIASDGEFGATPELAARLDAVKRKLGLRVQGVLIGDRETIGFLEVADDIYPLRDWRRYGGINADSPLPTHRLTAMYFPAALRNAENRQATLSGSAAASAVRAGRRHEESPTARPDAADEPR